MYKYLKRLGFTLALGLLFFTGCGKKHGDTGKTHTCADTDVFYDSGTYLHSFGENESYEATVNKCIFGNERCKIEEFPLIGLSKDAITTEDVLFHTFTTHEWMKVRFKEILETYSDELIQMFRHVTAVVISSEARPSHYWLGHGAIILDPQQLWLTEEERQDITSLEDCRAANFSKTELQFKVYSLDFYNGLMLSSLERSLEKVRVSLGTLLAHELAHAMDYTSQMTISEVNMSKTLIENYKGELLLSTRLKEEKNLALESSILDKAAQYFYSAQGVDPDEELLAATGTDIGEAFSASGALGLYSFTNLREDFAMLIEGHLSRKLWGVGSQLVVTDAPEEPEGCSDYLLHFSHENRDLSSKVSERMTAALDLSQATLALSSNLDQEEFSLLDSEPDFLTSDLCLVLNPEG